MPYATASTPPVSLHYQLLHMDHLHGSNHINCEQKNKSEIKKTKQYPVNTIVLQTPAQIISKNTMHFSIFICTDVNIQMITIHLRISVIIYHICTNTNNRIIVNHLHCKNHPKRLPRVTPLCLQSCTTIHTKIHLYALVHKIPPRNPTI